MRNFFAAQQVGTLVPWKKSQSAVAAQSALAFDAPCKSNVYGTACAMTASVHVSLTQTTHNGWETEYYASDIFCYVPVEQESAMVYTVVSNGGKEEWITSRSVRA